MKQRGAYAVDTRGYWWLEEGDPHLAVFNLSRAMEQEQATRRARNSFYTHLYGDRSDTYGYTEDGPPSAYDLWNERGSLSYNLIRVAVETLGSRVASTKPKASLMTDGGNWTQRRRAKKLDGWLFGVFHAAGLYAKAQDAFRDGAVLDVGVLKGYRAHGRIHFERVHPDEIKVGAMDGRDGKPRTLLQTRYVAREVAHALVEDWAEEKTTEAELAARHDLVEAAQSTSNPERHLEHVAALGDVVEIQEAWHLPSSPDAEDGRHVVCLSNLTLLDEAWTAPRFPFAFFRFSRRMRGWYAQGVADVLLGRQRSVNQLLRNLQDTLHNCSVARYFTRLGAQFNIRQLTNEPGTVMEGLEPPTLLTGNAVPPELFQAVEIFIRQSLEMVGVSEQAAAGRKPAGLASGEALRTQDDIQTGRFSLVVQAYEGLFLEAAQVAMDLGAQAQEEGENLEVACPRAKGLERISWKDAQMDLEAFTLKMHSTSSLPTTPAARRQSVQEMYDQGWIDGVEARRLLDMPDLEADGNLAMAARDDIDALVERFLDGEADDAADAYEPPDELQDLGYGVKRMTQAYLRAKLEGCPMERLELFRTWISQAKDLLLGAEQAAANDAGAAPAPGAGPMPGAPMPAPAPGAAPMAA